MPGGRSYSEGEAREAIAASLSYAEALRRLGMCATGASAPILKKWASRWGISTAHFDPNKARLRGLRRTATPLEEILVEGSTYHRGHLKRRLFEEGIKQRRCEICGQGERWHGRRIALILDHVNGVSTDNRLENLRIVCPNCAAALDTLRRVERTPYDTLRDEIERFGYSALGRKYGVSDNAIRKWVRQYQIERRLNEAA